MRKIALLAVVAFAASCGSSSDPAPAGASITGTVGTAPFTSASQLALVASGNACRSRWPPAFSSACRSPSANVADVAGTCSQIDLNCLSNSRNLQIIIAKVHVPNADVPEPHGSRLHDRCLPVRQPRQPDPAALAPDPSPATSRSSPAASWPTAPRRPARTTAGYGIASGTLNIAAVSGSTLTGTINVTLVNEPGAGGRQPVGHVHHGDHLHAEQPGRRPATLLNGIMIPAGP